MKVVINDKFGGFSISDAAYEKLIEWGIPVRKYTKQERGENGLYSKPPENEGRIIFDRELTPVEEYDELDHIWRKARTEGSRIFGKRYWDDWIANDRSNPLLIRVVEELGETADGECAALKIVEIPDGVEWEIDEYDGMETIHEVHRSWR